VILTQEKILEHHELGNIIIDPFCKDLVSINSVDIRLGLDLWKLKKRAVRDLYCTRDDDWEKVKPEKAKDLRKVLTSWFDMSDWAQGVVPDDADVFALESGGFYLGTTLEKVGATPKTSHSTFVPKMYAKSTFGRQGLTVAVCAGLGDVAYGQRWALEIRVVDCGMVPLAVGTPIGQVTFEEAYATEARYNGTERYQNDDVVRFLPKPLRIIA
jgi:deoxycytidine triphosphate deaminase